MWFNFKIFWLTCDNFFSIWDKFICCSLRSPLFHVYDTCLDYAHLVSLNKSLIENVILAIMVIIKFMNDEDIFKFCFGDSNRVEDAVIRYLNRKPAAGSDAPGSTWIMVPTMFFIDLNHVPTVDHSFNGSRIAMLLDGNWEEM